MKAINYYVVIEKIKEAPKKVGGLELTEDQNKDVRYLKGKVISAGNLVENLNEGDIVHYDNCGVNDFRTDDEVEAYARITNDWCMKAH